MKLGLRCLFNSLAAGIVLFAGCTSDPGAGRPSSGAAVKADGQDAVITAVEETAGRQMGNPRTGPSHSAARMAANASPADAASTAPAVLVTGRVSFADGKPATSATVELHGTSAAASQDTSISYLGATAPTNGEGAYNLRGPDVAALQLQVKGDFPRVQVNLRKKSGERGGRGNVLRIKQDIVLPAAHKISGSVINENGQAMAGLPVHLRPVHENASSLLMETRETTSTAAGEFSFDQVAGGQWMLGTLAPDYAPVMQHINIPTTEPVTLRLAARGGTVRGHVLMKAGSAPVAGMTVGLHSAVLDQLAEIENQDTVSAANGTFSFDHVSSGPKRLFVQVNEEQALGMTSPFPEHVRLDERETTDIALYVYPGHSVSGLVFDKDTSEPLSGATVSAGAGSVVFGAERKTREAVTGSDGKYLIEKLFPEDGDIDIRVKLDDFSLETGSPYSPGITAKPKEDQPEISKDLPMIRLVTIRGRVVTKDDVPIPHARVSFVNNRRFTNNGEKIPVKPDGTFEIETTPFIVGFVDAEANGYGYTKSELLEVLTKSIEGVKVVMEVGATIQGKVLLPDGTPATMAVVGSTRTYEMGNNSHSTDVEAASTDESGQFIMHDAPAKVELAAEKIGFATSRKTSLELKPGEVRTGVELQLREEMSISGRVVDSSRNPRANVSVSAYGNNASANATTGKGGAFTLKNLAVGTYSINVNNNGAYKSVPGIAAGTKDLEIVLEDTQPNTMIGTVVDDTTGDVIADFQTKNVKLKRLPEPGKFEFPDLNINSSYVLILSSPKHDEQTFQVLPRAGGGRRFEQTFRLGRNGAITGRVVKRGTTDPVPNVTVINWANTQSWTRSQKAPKNHTTTDAEGRFTLAPAPIGANDIVFKPSAPLTEYTRAVTVKSEETVDMGNIELAVGGTIRGQVLRGQDAPVSNISIEVSTSMGGEPISRKATTDAEGRFEVTGLPAESYTVSAGSVIKTVVLAAEATAEVTLRLGVVTMKGNVTRSGQPAQVRIMAMGPNGQRIGTYANGEYTIENVAPGSYEFTLGGPNAYKETIEVPDQAEFVKDFVLPDGRIRVSVVDSAGEPVADATVEISQKQSDTGFDQRWLNRATDARTGPDGVHEFEGLNPGSYSISARKADMGTAMNPAVNVEDGQTEAVRLELSKNGGTLVSVALSYATGQGLKEAWCYLYGTAGTFTHSAERDASGVMTIPDIPPGTYTTNVSYWSHSQSEQQVEIKAGETVTIEDVLYPAGAIHWLLRLPNGQPAVGATVTVTPLATTPEEKPRTGKTGSDGLYVERGLAGGTYQVTGQMAGKPPTTETFTVKSGDNAKKETTVPGW